MASYCKYCEKRSGDGYCTLANKVVSDAEYESKCDARDYSYEKCEIYIKHG